MPHIELPSLRSIFATTDWPSDNHEEMNQINLLTRTEPMAIATITHPLSRSVSAWKRGICTVHGCLHIVRSKGLCKAHGGGLRCQHLDCRQSDQGGGFCISHGGGTRCDAPGPCKNAAQSRGKCKTHGGGSLCNVSSCTRLKYMGPSCRHHGGKRYCSEESCKRLEQRAGLCSTHGKYLYCISQGCRRIKRHGSFCLRHATILKTEPALNILKPNRQL